MDEAADIEADRQRAIAEAAAAERQRMEAALAEQRRLEAMSEEERRKAERKERAKKRREDARDEFMYASYIGYFGDVRPIRIDPILPYVSENTAGLMQDLNSQIFDKVIALQKWSEAAEEYISGTPAGQDDKDQLIELSASAEEINTWGTHDVIQQLSEILRRIRHVMPNIGHATAETVGIDKRSRAFGNEFAQYYKLVDIARNTQDSGVEQSIAIMAWLEGVAGTLMYSPIMRKLTVNTFASIKKALNAIPKDLRVPFYDNIGTNANFIQQGAFGDLFGSITGIRLTGGGFATKMYQFAANAYRKLRCPGARMLEDGEMHPLCANWMGPGTNIEKASKYPSANAADDCARIHDLMYQSASKETNADRRASQIRKADERIIECLKNTNDTPYTQLGLAGIGTKMKAEDLIPTLTKALMGKEVASQYFGKKIGGCLQCKGRCSGRGGMEFGTFSNGTRKIM